MSANNVIIAENQQRVYDAGFKKAIERYAPEFTESGASVVCYPVGGFPLNVVSQITPIQAGSGDASPTNIRPITGHTAVKVTIANDTESAEYNTELGQAVYAGTFDWSTGLLTLTHKMLTFTGEEQDTTPWVSVGSNAVINYYYLSDSVGNYYFNGWCSHTNTRTESLRKGHANGYIQARELTTFWGLPDCTVETWIAFLKAQAAAGTPLQVLYELKTPLTVQLTPQEILALDGANTIRSDTGDTTVTGKGDWTAMVANLATEADYQEALREMGVNV
jgi:hypothetical protein